jgi:large subunit ribosomal protein L25
MQKITLEVDQRFETGKGPARRLRMAGKVPAILYGQKMEPINLSVKGHEFRKMLDQAPANPIFDLQIISETGTTSRMAMLKQRQVRPLDGALVHLDFLQISMEQPIEVTVLLEYVGEPIGVDKGGAFQAILRELKIEALPAAVPQKITVDVTNLDLGHSIHVGEITLPEGVKALHDASAPLATLLSARKDEAPGEAEEPPAE